MARKKETNQTPADMPELLPAKVTALVKAQDDIVMAKAQHDSAVRAVALQMGYQLPADCTDPDLIQRDISANMRRSVEACLQVGMGLRVLKAACHHGEFVSRLDVLGIEARVAQKFMQSAQKFSKAPTSALLKAAGGSSKLFEMLVLDDEQIEELELTGQTGELSLDDVATMSVKELRAALREERAEHQAKVELLGDKDASLNKLRAQLKRVKAVPADQALADLHAELAAHAAAAVGAVDGQLREAFSTLAEHHANHGGDSTQVMAGYVGQLQMALIRLREEHMLPDVAGDGSPEWQNWTPPSTAGTAPAKGKH